MAARHRYQEIRAIYPNFNIGISTGKPNGPSDLWSHPYRHWLFKPKDSVYDPILGRKGRPR